MYAITQCPNCGGDLAFELNMGGKYVCTECGKIWTYKVDVVQNTIDWREWKMFELDEQWQEEWRKKYKERQEGFITYEPDELPNMVRFLDEVWACGQRYPEVSFAKLSRIAKRFYKLGLETQRNDVWHDSNKEQPDFRSNRLVIAYAKDSVEVEPFVEVNPDRIWAYLDEILPKEDKK